MCVFIFDTARVGDALHQILSTVQEEQLGRDHHAQRLFSAYNGFSLSFRLNKHTVMVFRAVRFRGAAPDAKHADGGTAAENIRAALHDERDAFIDVYASALPRITACNSTAGCIAGAVCQLQRRTGKEPQNSIA